MRYFLFTRTTAYIATWTVFFNGKHHSYNIIIEHSMDVILVYHNFTIYGNLSSYNSDSHTSIIHGYYKYYRL